MMTKVSKQHYRELLQERAAILEFDGGWSKKSAATLAMLDIKNYYEIDPLLSYDDESIQEAS